MAKRIPKHIMYDKVGDLIPNDKAINPKGKRGSSSSEKQDRLISQFMNIAKNSRRPSEPTLLQKIIKQSKKRKSVTLQSPDVYARGLKNVSEDNREKIDNKNNVRLANMFKNYTEEDDNKE